MNYILLAFVPLFFVLAQDSLQMQKLFAFLSDVLQECIGSMIYPYSLNRYIPSSVVRCTPVSSLWGRYSCLLSVPRGHTSQTVILETWIVANVYVEHCEIGQSWKIGQSWCMCCQENTKYRRKKYSDLFFIPSVLKVVIF